MPHHSTCLSAGGTLLAAEVALQRGLACSTAGGTHHAFPGHGSGYCFLNDLAVAARLLTTDGGLDRVLIVDLDVHQASRLLDRGVAWPVSHCVSHWRPAEGVPGDVNQSGHLVQTCSGRKF